MNTGLSTEIAIHTDGASRGNPGPAAVAYVIKGAASAPIEFAETIGVATNNQAEYRAMVGALSKLVEDKVEHKDIACYADSELMVKQVNGEYRVKDVTLRPLFETIQGLVRSLRESGNTISFVAVRREHNARADALCNKALDGKLG